MPGLFQRVTNWIGLQTVTDEDLNNEFNNIIHHYTPEYMDDYSASVPQMQETLSPGAVSSEVKATTLAEELKQLRYMLKAITGKAQWYSPPDTTVSELATLFSAPNHRVLSGRVDAYQQPMWLVPNGSAASVSLQAASTNLATYINGTAVTFNQNLTKSSLTTAPSSNNTCLVNQSGLAAQAWSKQLGEGDSVIPIDNIGTEISNLNGKRAAFLVGTEYFLADIDSTNGYLKNCLRGYAFNSADANLGRTTISDNDTITLMKLTWVFATYDSSTQAIDVVYNQPTISYDQPSAPSTGDYWFDLSANRWKKYSGSFSATNAVFIGICIQNGSNCIAARSVDPYKPYALTNGIEMERLSNSTARVRKIGSVVSAYGTLFDLSPDNGTWDMAADLDNGVAEAASTTYYFYVTSLGDKVISDVAPYNRYADLKGAYHPFRPYRCVGSVFNDGSSNFLTQIGSERRLTGNSPSDVQNGSVRWSVAANALTIVLTTADGSDPSPANPVFVAFRGTSSLNGRYTYKRIEAALSLTVPDTATLGLIDATDGLISFLLATDGTRILPLVAGNLIGTRFDGLQTSVSATTLSTSSDAASTYYGELSGSTTVFAVMVAAIKCNQTTAGTYASNPTVAYPNLKPYFSSAEGTVTGNGAANHGSTDTRVRRIGSDATTTISDSLSQVGKIVTNAGNGTILTTQRPGLWSITYEDAYSGGTSAFGLSIGAGGSATTNYFSLGSANQLGGASAGANVFLPTNFVGYLPAGSEVRPHDNGNNDSSSVRFSARFIAAI